MSNSMYLKSMAVVVMLCGISLAAAPNHQQATVVALYVSTTGNDLNSGTKNKPFATLERARQEIRLLKSSKPLPSNGFTVEVHGGTYPFLRPLELMKEDSGTANCPVVYQARKGETVNLTGGREVSGWKQTSDPAVLARLDESARGKVWQADLKSLGITDFGEVDMAGKRLELFFQDKPMTLSRWPNEGFTKIAEVLGATPLDVRGTKGCIEGVFVYDGNRPQRWTNEPNAWLHGYWFWDWSDKRHPVESIDIDKHVIKVKPPYHSYGYRKGQWFYAFNLLCEIDSPGEWYLDRNSGVLYFWPPEPLECGKAVVSMMPTLVTMKDTSYVTLRGFTLEACRGTAITVSGGTNILIAKCTIRNSGVDAVSMSCTNSGIVGCDIYGTGSGGIMLTGGDRKTLSPGMLYAQNNHIHNYSRWDRMYHPAVSLSGVGNHASNNLIDNAPHMAIFFSGNDHLIELNEIHSVCTESVDAGAIYAGRDWTMRGTIIKNNYLHHINGFEGKGCIGVYLDDQFSGTVIYGNLFYKVTQAAFIGGGRDCTVENNIFVDCPPAVHVDARGLGWAAPGYDDLMTKLNAMPYKESLWSTRYPKLVNILENEPMAPVGNTIVRNICVGGQWEDLNDKAKPLVNLKDNLLDQDPLFVDSAHQNFQLKDNSPAYKLGFKPIPFEKIGLYQDELRASWPVKRMVRPPQNISASQ